MKSRTGNLDTRPISPVPRDKHNIKMKRRGLEGQKSKRKETSVEKKKRKEKKFHHPLAASYHSSEKANNQEEREYPTSFRVCLVTCVLCRAYVQALDESVQMIDLEFPYMDEGRDLPVWVKAAYLFDV